MFKKTFALALAACCLETVAFCDALTPQQRLRAMEQANRLPVFSSIQNQYVPRDAEGPDLEWRAYLPASVFRSPADPGVYYRIEQDGGLSRGDGAAWAGLPRPFDQPVERLLFDAADSNRLYAQARGVLISTSDDGGRHWKEITAAIAAAQPGRIAHLALDANGPETCRLWLGAGTSIYRSEDCGDTWTQAAHAATDAPFTSVAVSPWNGWVLAGTADGAIHSLREGAAEVRQQPRDGSVGVIAFDPGDECGAWVAYSEVGAGQQPLYRTTSCGDSWAGEGGLGTNALPNVPVLGLSVGDMETNRLYAATGVGLFVSFDRGISWAVEKGTHGRQVDSVDVEAGALVARSPASDALAAPHSALCAVTLSPAQTVVSADGGDGEFKVYLSGACSPWTITGSSSFVTILAGRTGSETGVVNYRVDENVAPAKRIARFFVSGKLFALTQEAAECQVTIDPNPEDIELLPVRGLYTLNVTASYKTCRWKLTSNVTWVRFSVAGGSGSRKVIMEVLENKGAERSTTIVFNGEEHELTQPALDDQ